MRERCKEKKRGGVKKKNTEENQKFIFCIT